MTSLNLYSEPFASTGNIAGEGFRRLLGRPALGLTQTVIRESLQNSLDASKGDKGPSILLRVRRLTKTELGVLRTSVLSSLPAESHSRKMIENGMSEKSLMVFEICDFGTSGLGGPVRADLPVEEGEDPDFVNFIRNVGAARDTHHGGGTYGYGKTSLYAMSRCATILVDSEARYGGNPTRRLIGCHLGDAFDAIDEEGRGKRYTGRHWWGVFDESDGIDPLEGAEASELAAGLGLPNRSESDTGTSIMILDPEFSSELLSEVEKELIETVLWNFWPRMTRTTSENRRLTVEIEIEGRRVELPEPEEFPPLDLFSAALANIRLDEGEPREIKCHRPAKKLGTLSIQQGIVADRDPASHREGSLVPRQCALIALMRPVEMVVKYVEGEPFPDGRFEWAGVFRCSDEDEVEDAFASAEPPAHDDWIPDNLPQGPSKTWVRVAMRRINEAAREYPAPGANDGATGEKGPSLARTATILGRMLDSVSMRGPGRETGGGGGGSGGRRRGLRVSQPVFHRLQVEDDGTVLAVFSATLNNDGSDPSKELVAEPFLVADGSATTAEDLDSDFQPSIHQIRRSGDQVATQSDRFAIAGHDGEIEVLIEMPAEAAVGLRLKLETQPNA